MKILITQQQKSFRGPLPAIRILGKQYKFEWNKELNSYAWEAPGEKEASELLRANNGSRMFIPGLHIQQETAAVRPVAEAVEIKPAEIPAAPVVESPIEEPPAATSEVPLPRKRGRPSKKG